MLDRIGVAHYPVNVTPVSGAALNELIGRLHTMQMEVQHLGRAVVNMTNGAKGGNSRTLTDAVMDSRNWTLSAVMSHCFIQSLLGAEPGQQATDDPYIARFQLLDLFSKAGMTGANDGIETRRRLNVRPASVSAQVNWDGRVL
jgi:hypothetical protein